MKKIILNLFRNKFDSVILAGFFLTALITILALTVAPIILRHNSQAYLYVHDNPIQLEEAIKFILQGKNPYTENYLSSPLEKWIGWTGPSANPSVYHFISLPFHLLFSIPFYLTSMLLMGWFDQRFVYMFALLSLVLLILKWPAKSLNAKFLFLTGFLINPWFYQFFMEGRNDIFVFFWIALSVYFLKIEKYDHSAIALALAATSKHTAWFILPFYFAYLFYNLPDKLELYQKVKNILQKTKFFFITASIMIVPFLIWDARSFIDDTVKYANGTAYMSYPMNGFGYGFYTIVLKTGLAGSRFDYWPFWIPQMIIGLPIFYLLLKMQKKNNSLAQMIFNLSVLLFTFWSFGRFFNDNYLGFLIMLFLFSIFLLEKPRKNES